MIGCTNVLHDQVDCPSSELPPSEWCEFCTQREAEDIKTIAEEKGMTDDEFNDWAEAWRKQ
jgi:hypothetical protein